MLASLEGVSPGQAKNTLTNGRRLDQLPGTEDAVRKGSLSAPKLNELTGAGVLDPARESELLEGAEKAPLQHVRERCHRSRATSRSGDPVARVREIRASRHFSSWTDSDGAFCYQGRDTADRGAQILTYVNHAAIRIRRARRAMDDGADEPEGAVRADAFFLLLTRRPIGSRTERRPKPPDADPPDTDPRTFKPPGLFDPPRHPHTGPGPGPGPGADPDLHPDSCSGDVDDRDDRDDRDERDERDDQPSSDSLDIIDRPPTCSVMVRVDLSALLRGHAVDGELCEIDGQGPIPVPMARDMANDSFLRLVFHRAGDIRAVSHLGRTINRTLRTALAHRDGMCVVPGCGVRFGLEIDHVIPVADDGPTELDNLALLCGHHHFLKTYEGWTLSRAGTKADGTPEWSFEAQPPFGQEPGLGIDTPEAREEWKHRHDGAGPG
jgi:5-methylcytosine-specific restriction endonuclease McrA